MSVRARMLTSFQYQQNLFIPQHQQRTIEMAKAEEKLQLLAEIEGFNNPEEMMMAHITDSVGPAICMNDECDYTTEMEHDQDRGWCEECNEGSMKSCFILGGVI